MKRKEIITDIIVLLLFDFLIFYLCLPTISIHNAGLWLIVIINLTIITLIGCAFHFREGKLAGAIKVPSILLIIVTAGLLLGAIASSRMFHAREYSKILDIETVEHVQLPKADKLNAIPLMDTESSKVLGNRKIGALNEIVSQFEVSDSYMTIAYHNTPVKVSALKYAGFWKWQANKKQGVPGYVMVRPNDLTAEYVELPEGMKYVPSAYLSQDLARYIYRHYPTVFFDNIHIELDEDGQPYYIATTYQYTIGLFGGKKITGAIIVNPCNGEIARYQLDQIPSWVDIIYNGDYIARYFDIYGRLINGFWNSLFGQKGLIESTTTTTYNTEGEAVRDNDFGYIIDNDDVLIYTGVTAVTNDESNIGYLMANERTGTVRVSYFESTDEDSVMRAAEGEVQEKGYRASFPSLIDLNGSPVYVMVLKDNLGLVKLYAVVDANQYSHMEVAETLEKALNQFTNGTISASDMESRTITIKKVELITAGGETMVYVVDTDSNIYYSFFKEELLLLEEGQTVTIRTDGHLFTLQD